MASPGEIASGVQTALDQYAQYDGSGNPITGPNGKKILNVELATGSSVIGTVAISQVTPGTTNGVVVNAVTASATTNKVDVGLVNGEAIDVGAGTEAAAIRVTLPTNGTGVIAGVTTVGAVTAITNALPAGTNAIGKLAANAGVVIGSVSVDQTTPGTTNAVANLPSFNSATSWDKTAAVSAYVASGIIKASAGTFRGLIGYNSGPAQWIMVFAGSATVPANATGNTFLVLVQSQQNFFLDVGELGAYDATGWTWSNSTTSPAKTLGAADCSVTALFK